MSSDSLFTPEMFTFLRQLKRHNNREWFARNKARYQQVVVDPALDFIRAFAAPLYEISPRFVADARPMRGSLFRIYRDTRFSPDKRPFKTRVGIHFSHESGKDAHAPVFYLNLEPENSFVAAGIWHPDNPALLKVRTAIVRDSQQWGTIRKKLELRGDSLKRPPRGFDPGHPFIDDIRMKDFVASEALTEQQVCNSKFLREFTQACRRMSPLVAFATKAVGLRF